VRPISGQYGAFRGFFSKCVKYLPLGIRHYARPSDSFTDYLHSIDISDIPISNANQRFPCFESSDECILCNFSDCGLSKRFFIFVSASPSLTIVEGVESRTILIRSGKHSAKVRLALGLAQNKQGLLGKAATNITVQMNHPSEVSLTELPKTWDQWSSLAWCIRSIPEEITLKTVMNLKEASDVLHALELEGYITYGRLDILDQGLSQGMLVMMGIQSSGQLYIPTKDPVKIHQLKYRKFSSYLPFQIFVTSPDLHKAVSSEQQLAVFRAWNDFGMGPFEEFRVFSQHLKARASP
jgi:hypothetical protein